MTAPTAEESRALLEPLTGCTPGPWRVEAPDGESIEIAGPVFAIAGLYDSADDDRCDARLIAAAPGLAAHLRAALDREAEALVQIGDSAEQIGWIGNDLKRAEAERDAALARAEVAEATIRRWHAYVQMMIKCVEEADAERDVMAAVAERLRRLALKAFPVVEWVAGEGFGDDEVLLEMAEVLGVEDSDAARAALAQEPGA